LGALWPTILTILGLFLTQAEIAAAAKDPLLQRKAKMRDDPGASAL